MKYSNKIIIFIFKILNIKKDLIIIYKKLKIIKILYNQTSYDRI